MKRLLALVAGALGLGALLRRHSQPPVVTGEPADTLRAKLARSRAQDVDGEPAVETAGDDVDSKRAEVHARARRAIDDLSS
jgi:hypothetical protein